jgi:hypothetical protein
VRFYSSSSDAGQSAILSHLNIGIPVTARVCDRSNVHTGSLERGTTTLSRSMADTTLKVHGRTVLIGLVASQSTSGGPQLVAKRLLARREEDDAVPDSL